jgi:uncharacterized membrane protein YgaE (UPF0421/DUF939 family)
MPDQRGTPVEWMRRVGAGERVLKTAFATALAWQIGSLIPGVSSPYLAPLGALLVMQVTIADSVKAATQRLLGIIVGVLVALVLLQVIGVNAWSIGLVVLLSLMVGSLFRLAPAAISQVAVSSLLVVAVGGQSSVGFAWHRIAETIIGVVVGVAVNFLLAPPSFLADAQLAARRHADALADVLDRTEAAIRAGITRVDALAALEEARASDKLLRAAQAALLRTENAHQYNVWARDERPAVARLGLQVRALERVGMQSRGVIRTIEESVANAAPVTPEWLEPHAFDGELASLIGEIASAIQGFPRVMDAWPAPPDAAFTSALREAATFRRAVEKDAEAVSMPVRSTEWVQLGSVLADLDRIRRELQAVADVGDIPDRLPPSTAPYD